MRILMSTAAVMALAACNLGAANNSASANKAAPATANATAPSAAPAAAAPAATASADGLPAGFPDANPVARTIECLAFVGVSRQANARPGGFDDATMNQAQDQWAAAATQGDAAAHAELEQAVAGVMGPMAAVPAAQRDAASAWCVQNAPEPDPEG